MADRAVVVARPDHCAVRELFDAGQAFKEGGRIPAREISAAYGIDKQSIP